MSAIAYRPEIDGLRAIAVLAVVGYHYGLPVPGGFAGVDIFFVISGYLITSLLARDLAAGNLSILSFYDRRIRRIVPALLLVMAATSLAGFVLLWPGDYASLGWSALYSAFGAGNIYFFLNTGYFDQAADLQPLLHLWSLGVEEQFYLVWPLLLLAAGRLTRSRMALLGLAAAILVASLAYAISILPLDPKAAFYLPTGRAWELALGAVLVFLPRPALPALLRNLAAAAGLVLTMGWLFVLNDSMPFPGLAAVPACLGAALLILACEQPTAVGAALSFGPLRFVGKISYSLYLWHWPILVLYRHFNEGHPPAAPALIVLAGLAVGVSWLSFRFVEQPFRRRAWAGWKAISAGLAAAMFIAAIGAGLGQAAGVPARISSQMRTISGLDVMWTWKCPAYGRVADELGRAYCQFGDDWQSAPTKVFLWGDSNAEQLMPLLKIASRGAGAGMMLFRECPAFISSEVSLSRLDQATYNPHCADARERAESYLTSHPEVNLVILAALWTPTLAQAFSRSVPPGDAAAGAGLMQQSLVALVDKIRRPGRRIYLLADIPILEGPPANFCAFPERRLPLRRPCDGDDLRLATARFHERQALTYATVQAVADATGTIAVLPGDALCGPETCTTMLDGVPIYRDRAHLRRNLPAGTERALSRLLGLDLIVSGH
ncbi:MAG: acyltransferase family protein [Devosia sp.]|nr:acyltransferase family protein [Devosia sp.]